MMYIEIEEQKLKLKEKKNQLIVLRYLASENQKEN